MATVAVAALATSAAMTLAAGSKGNQPDATVTVASDETFWSPGQRSNLRIRRLPGGKLLSLWVVDKPEGLAPAIAERNFSGAYGTYLGQRCRLWRLAGPVEHQEDKEAVQTGCTTATGADLWYRSEIQEPAKVLPTGRSHQLAPPPDARPPIELLDVTQWARPARRVDHSRDYEVVLESPSGGGRAVARRSGSWASLAEEPAWQARRTFTAKNLDAGLIVRFRTEKDRHRELYMETSEAVILRKPGEVGGPMPSASKDEVVLGLRCHWWNTSPGTTYGGTGECLTDDGVPLQLSALSWDSGYRLIAKRVRRGPQPLSAVLPGKDIASPAAWGF